METENQAVRKRIYSPFAIFSLMVGAICFFAFSGALAVAIKNTMNSQQLVASLNKTSEELERLEHDLSEMRSAKRTMGLPAEREEQEKLEKQMEKQRDQILEFRFSLEMSLAMAPRSIKEFFERYWHLIAGIVLSLLHIYERLVTIRKLIMQIDRLSMGVAGLSRTSTLGAGG